MAVDVSPEILEEIEKNFEEYYKDPNVKRIYKKIVDGTATYSDMQILSSLVAKHIYQSTEKAYTNALDSGKLPNDKLYQNIVDKTMRPTLKDGHGLIVEACGDVQTDLNRKSGIKLNAVEPVLNENKVSGLIYQITNTNETRLSRTVLSGLIDTFCRSVVDDFVHANLDFQKESGLSPQISRTRGANSNSKCAYCAALVYTGEYKGPSMPEEIFRRHRYCHCNVLYNPMNGKKLQDVWSKREYQDYREAEQKQRQYLAELDKMTPTERRLARNARARELRRAKYTPQEWERRKALERSIAETRTGGLSLEERKVYTGLKVGTPATGMGAQKRIASKVRVKNKELTALSKIYVNNDDLLKERLSKVKPRKGFSDYGAHGDANSAFYYSTNGQEVQFSAKDFADLIKSDPDYDGGNVRLLICNAGERENGFAQRVADELGRQVIAPTEALFIDDNGNTFITNSDVLAEIWYNGVGVQETGRWKIFNPK